MSTAKYKELRITRIFNAPRELVFDAWVNPKQLAKWWGPRDFTNPTCEVNAKPGGKIYIDMTAPDGTSHPMGGHFDKIVRPELLVFTALAFDDAQGNAQLRVVNTVTFIEEKGKTKITLHAEVIHATPAVADALAGMDQGWNQSLDRLDNLVAPNEAQVKITRTFNAPRSMVFKAFTDKEILEKWYAPGDCTIEFKKLEAHKGGLYHSVIKIPNHHDCWCMGTYLEFVEPEKIVFTMAVANGEGKYISPSEVSMDLEWPFETIVTILFEDAGNKTKVILRQTVAASLAQRTGALPSWLLMFDKLDGMLK